MEKKQERRMQYRRRAFEIIEAGKTGDWVSKTYDIINLLTLVVNLAVTFLYTFNRMEAEYGDVLLVIEAVTVAFFALDYSLRVWTAPIQWSKISVGRATVKYILSFSGIVDLLSFLPYYLPIFFPTGTAVFRLFRVVRIFRLFQINNYYSSMNVITDVLRSKRQQLVSSVFIILVLMLASSMVMYSLENAAQPEVFSNAFSGIWWAVSTLLTVGYGDIYPITDAGKLVSIVITFLGVGMVAIPTGIISAGFVDQYSRLKQIADYAKEEDVHFIKVHLQVQDSWVGKQIKDLGLPHGVLVAMIHRGRERMVPRGDVVLRENDVLILGAEGLKDDVHIELKEIILHKHHPWNGQRIMDLDISRKTVIIMIKRNGRAMIPKGGVRLHEDDHVIVYTHAHIAGAELITI